MQWIDICHGIGGFRLGLEKAGWSSPVCSIDINHQLSAFYARKFTNKGVITLDIFDAINALKKLKKVDLLVCGAPCQPFSHANFTNRKQTAEPDTRIWVPYAAVELSRSLQADFVIENVLGILDYQKGEWFLNFLTFCHDYGYHVAWTYMDCSLFGTPSKRGHVLLFGTLAQGSGPLSQLFSRKNGFSLPEAPEKGSPAQMPFRLTSARRPGIGTPAIAEISIELKFEKRRYEIGNEHYIVSEPQNSTIHRIRSFGLREMEWFLGFPEAWTEGLPRKLADQGLADSFPPPAAQALGEIILSQTTQSMEVI